MGVTECVAVVRLHCGCHARLLRGLVAQMLVDQRHQPAQVAHLHTQTGGRQIDRYTDTHTETETETGGRQTDTHRHTQTGRQTYRHRQADTHRQARRQTDR